MVKKILIILSFMAAAAPHLAGQGLVFADVPLSQQADPCPPECVTDSMEIVTWYPSPYNEYEELRLYPTQRDANYCDNEKIGLMYYDHGGTPSFPDNDKMMICKGTLLGWQEVGGEGFWKFVDSSTSDIYYTKSGNVGIGTDTPQAKVHIKESGPGGGQVGVVSTFNYTGSVQYYTVPVGIVELIIDAYGAQGGNSGGRGGMMKGTFSVTPGQTLYVYVGGQGPGGATGNPVSGGFNGGGTGYGGGGGASDVRQGSASLADRIIVSGGGGGNSGSSTGGSGGGLTGGNGGLGNCIGNSAGGGYGGSQSAGGAGGTAGSGGGTGSIGTLGNGGNGNWTLGCWSGSGGGGGYYGGGGGGSGNQNAGGSGGGGSSYVIATAIATSSQTGANSGNGRVVITTATSGNPALYVEGTLGVTGSKNFEISHPAKPGMKLVHSSLEGPEIGVYYRGQARLDNGQTVIILPDYFEALTRVEDRTVQLTAKGESPFLLSYAAIKDGKFSVYGTNPDGEFSWEVKAVRKDIPPLVVEKE